MTLATLIKTDSPKVFGLETEAVSIKVTELGAAMLSFEAKQAGAAPKEILRGPTELKDRIADPPYHGAAIGRVANRIAKASYEGHTLSANEGENQLHGGQEGFHAQVWQGRIEADSLVFELESKNGAMGYPGTLKTTLVYRFKSPTELELSFTGCSDQDGLFNPTNHNFYNLDPEADDIKDQVFKLAAKGYTPANAELIPDGRILDFEGFAEDLSKETPFSKVLEDRGMGLMPKGGLDHNFILDEERSGPAAQAYSPASGLSLKVYSDLPALQVYTCNDPFPGMDFRGRPMGRFYAFCFEPQFCPDAVHHEAFQTPRIYKDLPVTYSMVFCLEAVQE